MRRRLTLIGSMLLHKGDVDGLICGTWGTTALHLHYIDQVIGKRTSDSSDSLHDTAIYACMNGLMLPGRREHGKRDRRKVSRRVYRERLKRDEREPCASPCADDRIFSERANP